MSELRDILRVAQFLATALLWLLLIYLSAIIS